MKTSNPQLTERDVALLVDLYKFRYLSATQIQELHFPSITTRNRRLRKLRKLGHLKDFTASGISEVIYYLTVSGARIVADALQVELEQLRWHRTSSAPKDYYFLRHFMAINNFRISLTLACQTSELRLMGFIPEYIGEKTKDGYVKKYLRDKVCDVQDPKREISHTPDAVFALAKGRGCGLFYVECDRGIEAVNDPEKGFLKSIVFYLNCWEGNQFKRYEQDFTGARFSRFRVLIVTSSAKRLQNMREAVTKYPFKDNGIKRFFWGATNVTKDNIFYPIWQSFDITDDKTYTIG